MASKGVNSEEFRLPTAFEFINLDGKAVSALDQARADSHPRAAKPTGCVSWFRPNLTLSAFEGGKDLLEG